MPAFDLVSLNTSDFFICLKEYEKSFEKTTESLVVLACLWVFIRPEPMGN